MQQPEALVGYVNVWSWATTAWTAEAAHYSRKLGPQGFHPLDKILLSAFEFLVIHQFLQKKKKDNLKKLHGLITFLQKYIWRRKLAPTSDKITHFILSDESPSIPEVQATLWCQQRKPRAEL